MLPCENVFESSKSKIVHCIWASHDPIASNKSFVYVLDFKKQSIKVWKFFGLRALERWRWLGMALDILTSWDEQHEHAYHKPSHPDMLMLVVCIHDEWKLVYLATFHCMHLTIFAPTKKMLPYENGFESSKHEIGHCRWASHEPIY